MAIISFALSVTGEPLPGPEPAPPWRPSLTPPTRSPRHPLPARPGEQPPRAILIKQLALALTMAGQSISADGFKILTLGKGKDLLEVALAYTRQADAEDALINREADGSYTIVNTRLRELPRDTLGLRRSF